MGAKKRRKRIQAVIDGAASIDTGCVHDGLLDDPDRYLLVEESKYGQLWLSTHETPAAAASYHDHQEYADDWTVERLINLDTGDELEPVTTTTWE